MNNGQQPRRGRNQQTRPTVGILRRISPRASLAGLLGIILAQAWAVPAEATSALAISKAADQASVWVGDPIGFTVTVTNTGSEPLRDVSVSDVLPTDPGTSWSIDTQTGAACSISGGSMACRISAMAAGASYSVHVASPTTADTLDSSPVDNTASARTSRTSSSRGASATASASIEVLPPRVATSISTIPAITTPTLSCGLGIVQPMCWKASYRAVVSAANGDLINEGTVGFWPDEDGECSAVPVVNGHASCTTNPIPYPDFTPSAAYSGSPKYAPSSTS